MKHNEEPHDVYGATSVAGMVKCIRLRWAGHVTSIKKQEQHAEFLAGKLLEINDLGN
jgi:hypothetical protein